MAKRRDEVHELMDEMEESHKKMAGFARQIGETEPLDPNDPRDMLLLFVHGQVQRIYRVLKRMMNDA